jgi:hypothetical protein
MVAMHQQQFIICTITRALILAPLALVQLALKLRPGWHRIAQQYVEL